MAFDYSQVWLIEDGKIAHIKEFREHDDALARAESLPVQSPPEAAAKTAKLVWTKALQKLMCRRPVPSPLIHGD